MIAILLFIVWVVITFFIFKAANKHNKDIKYKIYKATWEPYFFSAAFALLLFLYWFAQQL